MSLVPDPTYISWSRSDHDVYHWIGIEADRLGMTRQGFMRFLLRAVCRAHGGDTSLLQGYMGMTMTLTTNTLPMTDIKDDEDNSDAVDYWTTSLE